MIETTSWFMKPQIPTRENKKVHSQQIEFQRCSFYNILCQENYTYQQQIDAVRIGRQAAKYKYQ